MSEAQPIHVLNKRVQLLQAEGGFRTSLDSVMLAAACPAKAGDHILDLGCGVGSAGLCVLTRVTGMKLTGLDIQPDHVTLAQKNAALNGCTPACTFLQGDIRDFEGKNFEHVICNPPFLEAGAHTVSPSSPRATALGHAHENMNVGDWIDAGFRALKNGGSFTIIHRADQSDKIIQGFGKRFGAIEIIPLWPRTDEAAKRVIIRALKNRKTPLTLHAGLVLHQANGDYTPEADQILRHMQVL